MAPSLELRQDAEALVGPLPPLLADAEQLATTVLMGTHGRRRAGSGDEFWQYRHAHQGDSARAIDWRRSARTENAHFVREKEWQAAQTVQLWVDASQSMRFASSDRIPTKGARARLLAMAIAILLVRAGERVGLSGSGLPPRAGELHLQRLAALLSADDRPDDYGAPEHRNILPWSRALFVSDFLGGVAGLGTAMTKAADRGVKGVLLQVLDPHEEAFPFDGRTRFESMTGALQFETRKAAGLRDRYLDRLALRKAELADLAAATDWRYDCHHTDHPAQGALLWLYEAIERVR